MKRVCTLALVALLLCVARSAAAQDAPKPAAPAGPKTPFGDVAVGYSYVSNVPLGVKISDGYRLAQHADFNIEGTFGHGNIDGIGVSTVTLMGGITGKFSSRYGAKSAGLVEVLAGYVHAHASDGFESAGAGGFGVKFGGGADIGINDTVSIRPMLDGLFAHLLGGWTSDVTFTLCVAFKLRH
jgi:hypothetical protein